MITNMIFPAPQPNPYEAQMAAMAETLNRYRLALELIRDHSTDLNAVALANNVLMGMETDFGFIVFPARPKHQ